MVEAAIEFALAAVPGRYPGLDPGSMNTAGGGSIAAMFMDSGSSPE
jgi:hypothetical protein